VLAKDKIYSMDLTYNDTLVPFVIKTMEEIDEQLGGISDSPPRLNYYPVNWSSPSPGKKSIAFNQIYIRYNSLFFV